MKIKLLVLSFVALLFSAGSLRAYDAGEVGGIAGTDLLSGKTLKDFGASGLSESAEVSPTGKIKTAMRLTVNEAKANTWDAAFGTKIENTVEKNDLVVLIFYARLAENETRLDQALIGVNFQKASPNWASAYSKSDLSVSREWKRFFLSFQTKIAFDKGDSKLNLFFGAQKASIEVAGITFVNFGNRLTPTELEQKLAIPDAPLSLASTANMDFKDETAGDGRGGWSDQGPRDFRNFDTSRSQFGGVDFAILDPNKNGGRAVITFKSPHVAAPLALEQVDIPASGRGRFLYLLHTTAWCGKKGERVGQIAIHLKNGESVTREVVSLRDVADWGAPKACENAQPVYQVDGDHVACVFLSKFEIDFTPREVVGVTFKTTGDPVWIIVGATLSGKNLDTGAPPTALKPVRLLNVFSERKEPLLRFEGETVVVSPRPSTNVLVNPGKGWILYDLTPEKKSKESLALVDVGYARFDWAKLQPEENKLDWTALENAIQVWNAAGKRFAFGVMFANSSTKNQYVTPKWVFDAGASSRESKEVATPRQIVPDNWEDPIFLDKAKKFLTALAERYDGDPRLAFIDIRSYGNWGEGHLFPIGGQKISTNGLHAHVKMHLDLFKKSLLVLTWGEALFNPIYDWAISQGAGLRRDGILGNSDGSELIRCGGTVPAVMEWHGSYKSHAVNKEATYYWGDKFEAELTAQTYRASATYQNLGQWGEDSEVFLRERRPLIEELANRMGYHFVVNEARFPKTISSGTPCEIQISLENRGLAPITIPASLVFALVNAEGTPAASTPAPDLKLSKIKSDQTLVSRQTLRFQNVAPGDYFFAVGILRPGDGQTPSIRFAIENQNLKGWSLLGPVKVK